MNDNAIRFACNGCGVCCKGRLIPLTLDETRQWLQRGHDVAVLLEAFDESTWSAHPGQYAHSAKRAAVVQSGNAAVRVVAIMAANALQQCPNLGTDDRCGIYDERPLVCRIYPMEINPFIALRPEDKACAPQVWEAGAVLFTDRIVDPILDDQVERSRQADRDDAQAKVAICESMGLNVAGWKGNALAIYLPGRAALLAAIDRYDAGMPTPPVAQWKVRADDDALRAQLNGLGVSLDELRQSEYIFHRM